MYPYRVFISYSHDDSWLAEKLHTHLQKIGARIMSDVDIIGGKRFSDEILDINPGTSSRQATIVALQGIIEG